MSYIFGFFLPLIGVALVIFLLSLIQSSIDEGMSQRAGQSDNERGRTESNDEVRIGNTCVDSIATAIGAYQDQRDSHERERARRDHKTIIVLGLTAVFALLAAAAAIYSDWIFQGQLKEMQITTGLTKDSFTVVQRAFITITELEIRRGNVSRFINGIPESRFWMIAPKCPNLNRIGCSMGGTVS
jgi:hypothetical protein